MKTQHAMEVEHNKVNNTKSGVTNQPANQISKRSTIMNATRILSRAFAAVLSVFLMAGLVFGQNLNLNGTGGTLSGNWTVKGNISTGAATGSYSFTSGTVYLAGTGAGAQTIANGTGVQALTFDNLNAGNHVANAKNVSQGGDVIVGGTFTVDIVTGGGTYTATTLTLGGTVSNPAGTLAAVATEGGAR